MPGSQRLSHATWQPPGSRLKYQEKREITRAPSLGTAALDKRPKFKGGSLTPHYSQRTLLRRLILLDGESQLGLGLKEVSAIRYLIKCHLNYSNNPWLSDLGAV